MHFAEFERSNLQEVSELFKKVFSNSEGKGEGKLISDLVNDLVETTDSQDILGFVVKHEEKIIGSIFFSRMFFESEVTAFILSPVAVHIDFQRKGIGTGLISFGIEHLKVKDVILLFTYGDPNFYSKVGFKQISEDIVKAPLKLSQPEGWLVQSLKSCELGPIQGVSRCVDALNKQEYW